MAQMMLQDKVEALGLSDSFIIDSKAVSSEELGNPIYPPALRTLKTHGIKVTRHSASRFEVYDYPDYDYIVAMDNSNMRRLEMICHDKDKKYRLLSSFMRLKDEVSDPWYTRDFESCYQEIDKYLEGFIKYLKRYNKIK